MAKLTVHEEDSARRIRLVHQAMTSNISNCVEWITDRKQKEVTANPDNQGLTANEIRKLAIEWVRRGGTIDERGETDFSRNRDYWYRIIVEVDGFPRGLFVEIELTDEDEECPMVSLLNAHPQLEGRLLWKP